jgi:hypothetical protein
LLGGCGTTTLVCQPKYDRNSVKLLDEKTGNGSSVRITYEKRWLHESHLLHRPKKRVRILHKRNPFRLLVKADAAAR